MTQKGNFNKKSWFQNEVTKTDKTDKMEFTLRGRDTESLPTTHSICTYWVLPTERKSKYAIYEYDMIINKLLIHFHKTKIVYNKC